MTKTELSKQLTSLHARLPTELQYDFRRLLQDFVSSFYTEIDDVLESYKKLVNELIPGDVITKDGYYGTVIDDGTRIDPRSVLPTFDGTKFIPVGKSKTTKGDPLAELLHSIPQEQRDSLIEKLQKKTEG